MFGKLKDKLKGALKKFSSEVEEEATVEETTEEVVEEITEEPEDVVEETDNSIEEEPDKKETTEEPAEDKVEEPVEEDTTEEVVEKVTEPVKEEKEEVVEEKPVKEETKETVEEEPTKEEITEEVVEKVAEPVEEPEKKRFLGKLFKKKQKEVVEEEPVKEETKETVEEEPTKEEITEEVVEDKVEEKPVEEPKKKKKKSLFSKITKVTLTEDKFEDLFWDLEVVLLENNVAVEVIERIKTNLKEVLNGERATKYSIEELIEHTLKSTIEEILSVKPVDLLKAAEEKNKAGEPLIIAMVGVNGSGKTTSLAKLAHYFQKHNKSMVVAAADTFRAAAIHQLEEHTTKLGVKLIKHDYHADPAAVAYDAVKHAKAKNLDIVLIDSAGRLHSNDNLMNELKKLIRINKPDISIFVGESITGNDCVEQATLFNEAVGIDAIILAKADVDDKGGAAISASYVTGKPVIFLGTGQTYDDLEPFNPEKILKSLDL